MASNLASDIQAWAAKVEKRLSVVAQASTIEVARDVRLPLKQGGNMPVRRGNLRNSLVATLNGGLPADQEVDELTSLGDPMSGIVSTIGGAKIGDTISLSFTVDYANEQERKHAFVRLTAQKWPIIVDTVVIATKRAIP